MCVLNRPRLGFQHRRSLWQEFYSGEEHRMAGHFGRKKRSLRRNHPVSGFFFPGIFCRLGSSDSQVQVVSRQPSRPRWLRTEFFQGTGTVWVPQVALSTCCLPGSFPMFAPRCVSPSPGELVTEQHLSCPSPPRGSDQDSHGQSSRVLGSLRDLRVIPTQAKVGATPCTA